MKRLFWCLVISLLAAPTQTFAQNKDATHISIKNAHKTYGNNNIKHSSKTKAPQKGNKPFKASSVMDTIGDKLNSHKNDK